MKSAAIIQHCELLAYSYQKVTGQKLLPVNYSGEALAKMLYNAPFVLLSHGTEADPIFNYANLKGQNLWELHWDQFIQMPSRLSAEPVAVPERQAMLEEARQKGYISNYQGVRISSTGKRFIIKGATLWNIHDQVGIYRGQAVVFAKWEFI